MEAPVRPASSVPDAWVKDYLASQGMSSELIEWKFFEPRFNRDRERGFVWVHGDRVRGFIGFVPFVIAKGDDTWDALWLCEWSREPCSDAPRGIGKRLITEAAQAFDHLLGFGGTKVAQVLHPRIATTTIEGAGVTYHLPLRLGAVLRKLARRARWLGHRHWPLLSRVPICRMPRTSTGPPVRVESGVSEVIEPLIASHRSDGWHARYDLDYLQWQVERCPTVVSGTCYVAGDSAPPAAVVFWRERESSQFWRITMWARPGATRELEAVLVKTIKLIYDGGGLAVSILVSHRDEDAVAVLEQRGFMATRHHLPLYIYAARSTSQPIDDVRHLGYMDGDLAYRF